MAMTARLGVYATSSSDATARCPATNGRLGLMNASCPLKEFARFSASQKPTLPGWLLAPKRATDDGASILSRLRMVMVGRPSVTWHPVWGSKVSTHNAVHQRG